MSQKLEASSAGTANSAAGKPVYEPASVVRHIAHELRQPLSTIESIAFYLEMVLPRTEGKARRQLAKLQQEVHQINWILSDAIHFLRAAPLNLHLMDLSEVVSRCLSEWNSTQSTGVSLRLAEDLPLIQLDLEQIQHLLRNIVAFFTRIAEPERPIMLRTFVQDGRVALEVNANAPHCTEADTQPLFEPFDSHLPGGSGLGLASVRRIAEAHGASLDMNVSPAGSVTLTLAFPVA